ncbi:MAG: hypothetical protein JSW60_03445 [Thermoplasmatales archaeon]|nr:MAG: hypothetical protein JSW60_03445 [Thermoplasmatales archaeon]
MARILYGLCGEGFGHASRCKILINHLKKNHDIRIVAGGKAYKFLSKEFDNVEEIESPRLIFEGNDVKLFHSILVMLYRTIVSTPFSFFKVRSIFKDFKPDILITDADPISHSAARFSRVKRMSIDNPQALLHRKYNVPFREFISWFVLMIALKISMFGADRYIIYDFFEEQAKDPRVLFLKPLIPEGILKQQPIYGDHIFVYQSLGDNDSICGVLKKFNETFVIYGFNKNKVDGNLIFKEFNQDEIYQDIAHAKAVITNGGFAIIGEALYLKKPIFSIPIKYQFEQHVNGQFVEKLGAGVCHMELNEEDLRNFLNNIRVYKENSKNYNPGNREETLKKIEEEIYALLPRKKGNHD